VTNAFDGQVPSGPAGGASALPRPSSRNRGSGPTSKGKIGKGERNGE